MQLVLPTAHKYAFQGIITRACTLVTASLSQLNGHSHGPTSLLAWLQLAESLQLDALKASLVAAIQGCSNDVWGLIAVDTGLATLQVRFVSRSAA